jgi:hypothetical protein
MVRYLYCINELGDDDFITTSFTNPSYLFDYINIFNFNQEINIEKIKYVAIDYSEDPFLSFNGNKYSNSRAIKFYEVKFLEQDRDRMTAQLIITKEVYEIDLRKYKRNLKIENIINETK